MRPTHGRPPTARLRIAVALLASVLACADERPPAPRADARAETSVPRFVPGEVMRFRLDWKVDSNAVMPGVLPSEVPVSGGLHLRGTLALRVVGPTAGGSLVGLAFETLGTHEVTIMGENVVRDPALLLGHEAFLVVPDDGGAGKLYFDPSAPPLFRHLMSGLAGQTELRVLPRDRGPHVSRVLGAAGVADAEYAWSGEHELRRTLQRYVRFDAASSPALPNVEGDATITLDERALPVRIDAAEIVSVRNQSGEQDAFSAHASFSLVREGIVAGAATPPPVLADLVAHDVLGLPDDAEAQRVLAQQFAEDIELVDVALAIRSASNGLRPAPGVIMKATGLLRGWPETAAELEEMFWSEADPGRMLTFDLLASAGTPEAQAIMRRVLGDARMRDDPSLPQLTQRLSFLWRPMPETAQFVLEEHARARDEGRSEQRAALLYPMGVVARRVAPIEPLLAQAVLTRVREDLHSDDRMLRVSALAGLGNAGDAADLPSVLRFVDDADVETRAQAGSSLRLYPARESTAALVAMLYDPEWTVSQMALSVLDAYHYDAHDSVRLACVALGGGFSQELDGRMISALGRRRDDDPLVRTALMRMRAREADPTERARIDGILADGLDEQSQDE